ncbi:MAG: histidine phosphatase family protein [Azoarcus sp.]|nr:histidine phosphatase family protein [Azoarcus sp.]
MELLLWRHAEALDGSPDHARELSPRGRKQAEKVAAWLSLHAPGKPRLLVSPTVRTRQTAGFLLQGAGAQGAEKMEIHDILASAASPAEILSYLDWPKAQTPLLVVGHQPMLGEIAARLLGDAPYPSSFRKGALWWLRGEPERKAAILWQVVEAETLPDVAGSKPEEIE